MKKNTWKRYFAVVMAAVLALVSSFAVFAETAKETSREGGRSVIVQDVRLEGEGASAKIIRGTNEFAPAAGVRLAQGDVIRTEGKAVVYLSIDAQMVLRMDYNTEAIIQKTTFGQKLVVNVQKGHMFYNVAKQTGGAESLELMSNNITIAIRGTSGQIGTELGKLQHQLYDGVVEVSTEGKSIEQTPGQMLEVAAGPGGGFEGKLTVEEFTLADVPKSLVEEMKKDDNLKDRVLQNVPLVVDADGNPVYADAQTFEETVTGRDDNEVFAGTSRQNIAEAYEEQKKQQPEPEPSSDPDPEPEPVIIECPGCGEMVEKGDPAHDLIQLTEMPCGGACREDGKPVCKSKYNAADHKFIPFGCEKGHHGYYVCCGDGSDAADHAAILDEEGNVIGYVCDEEPPGPVLEECPYCKEQITKGDPNHGPVLPEEMACGGVCCEDGKPVCKSKYTDADHTFKKYECEKDGHGYYPCCESGDEAEKHAPTGYDEEGNVTGYKCDTPDPS